jgi:hypothetical protein
MTLANHVMALLCVILIATGQILFKLTANSINAAGTIVDRTVVSLGLASLAIYAVATVLWVFLLQTAQLSRAYPYMALSFVIGPGELGIFPRAPFSVGYMGGLMLIVIGLVIAAIA